MKNDKPAEDLNISRRNFLKKLAGTAVFTVPTIQTISLLQSDKGWWWWTGHHHHRAVGQGDETPPLPPPPPPGL